MAMGVVTPEEFDRQLENVTQNSGDKFVPPVPIPPPNIITDKTPVIEGEVLPLKRRGRQIGDVDVPESLRKIIAETHHIEGRPAALALAAEFGVSASSVSAYAKGATSTTTYNEPKKDIIDFIQKRKGRVTKKALRVMISALDELTPDRIAGAKAKDVSGIARDMGAIIGNMADKVTQENNNTGPTFVLYSPPQLDEDKFKVIPSTE